MKGPCRDALAHSPVQPLPVKACPLLALSPRGFPGAGAIEGAWETLLDELHQQQSVFPTTAGRAARVYRFPSLWPPRGCARSTVVQASGPTSDGARDVSEVTELGSSASGPQADLFPLF